MIIVPSSHGFRVKTRKLSKKDENRGFTRQLLENMQLKIGDRVIIKIDPSFHKGMPHRRYHGKVGLVIGKRGRAFEVKTRKGEKEVVLIVRPEHLIKFSG